MLSEKDSNSLDTYTVLTTIFGTLATFCFLIFLMANSANRYDRFTQLIMIASLILVTAFGTGYIYCRLRLTELLSHMKDK